MRNATTSKRGIANAKGVPIPRHLYEEDSRMLSGMATKYEGRDQAVFDAFIDLRELLLRKLGKGMT